MIYEKYEEQASKLIYNPERPWEYDNDSWDIMFDFLQELETVYETCVIPVEAKAAVWNEAWDRGHAEGYGKVEEIYAKLAKEALTIYYEELYSAYYPEIWEELDTDFSVDMED